MIRRFVWYVAALVFVLAGAPSAARAQSAMAALSGTVLDETGAVVPDVQVTVINLGTGLQRTASAGSQGRFVVPLLPPGRYSVTAQRDGFTPAAIKELSLNVGDDVTVTMRLTVATVGETVAVQADASRVNTAAGVGAVVDRQFVERLPLNGRSFQSLISLSPGLVITKANGTEQGQFSVNGQRANANYFMVDGVSANVGSRASSLIQNASGTLPALTASGGTNNLVSVDAMQEFRVQTSSYAPEFGRTPGAQISIVTRSGTNQVHGTASEYFRNDALDANDWFVNRNGQPKPALRQHDFGGVLGGPLLQNRAFYFASYEGLRLRLPQTLTTEVPSLSAREQAIPGMRPFLAVYPLPNGPETKNGLAQFSTSYSDPSTVDSTSVRLDHQIAPGLSVFGRYNVAPSNVDTRALNNGYALSVVVPTTNKTEAVTAGSTWTLSPQVVNDLRVNWTRSQASSIWRPDTMGGAVPLDPALVFPDGYSTADGIAIISISGGLNQSWGIGTNAANTTDQINIVDTLTMLRGAHRFKLGVDYRRLRPTYGVSAYSLSALFASVAQLGAGQPSVMSISANGPAAVVVQNLSLFAQDDWRMSSRATLTYGVCWEYGPPPTRAGGDFAVVTGLDDFATARFAPPGTPLYRTTYGDFAPRIGLVYQIGGGPGRETVLRGGTGLFYDLKPGGILGSAMLGYPYSFSRLVTPAPPFPPDAAARTPPDSTTFPLGGAMAFDPGLKTPRTYEWNVAVEQALGRAQRLTVTYVGAAGRNLLRQDYNYLTTAGIDNPTFQTLTIATNDGYSNYRSLQIEFQRRLSRGLQALAGYTWARSFDNVSGDAVQLLTPSARLDTSTDYGPSDFDVRHTVTAGVTYEIPSTPWSGPAGALLRGWSIDVIGRARTAMPVNVTLMRNLGYGDYSFRPDFVSGVPLYLDDPSAPGGWRFNPAAFVIPAETRQGTLARNALRGFGLSQVDVAFRRRFRLTAGTALLFSAELFNVFNTPNFADPTGQLTSALFGVSTQMTGRSLGGGGTSGGMSPLYQVGGPRSTQLAIKFQF